MSTSAALVMQRLAEQANNLALDADMRRLLADAHVQLIRAAPELRALGEEISDSAWLPDEASHEMVIAAAMTHAGVIERTSFCLRIPGTQPQLGVALGPYEVLQHATGNMDDEGALRSALGDTIP